MLARKGTLVALARRKSGRQFPWTLTNVRSRTARRRPWCCRYLLRPPFALGAVQRTPGGQVRVHFKKPNRNGATYAQMSPERFLAPLCALVPPPGAHTVRYYGALAPRGAGVSPAVAAHLLALAQGLKQCAIAGIKPELSGASREHKSPTRREPEMPGMGPAVRVLDHSGPRQLGWRRIVEIGSVEPGWEPFAATKQAVLTRRCAVLEPEAYSGRFSLGSRLPAEMLFEDLHASRPARLPRVGERVRACFHGCFVSPSTYRAISRALEVLLDESWPGVGYRERTAWIAEATTDAEFHSHLEQLFAHVHATYQGAHFWVKNSKSHFLAACPNMLNASGLDRKTLLSGINDIDARLPWMRQGPLYVRDDRAVLLSGVPKLDILERQDRDEETIWLKTSKVPYALESGGSEGTLGGFQRISAKAAWKLRLDSES